jgi:hypothetical protein
MVFSAMRFPGHQFRLQWRRADGSGNIYYSAELDAEGWLCPALLRYFDGSRSSRRPSAVEIRVGLGERAQ